MRQATEAERQQWLAQAAYVVPAVEILTANIGGDSELAVKLESSLPDAESRFALVWPYFLRFLIYQDWPGVWDDFCVWFAEERTGIELGYAIAEIEPEDELAFLVDRYTDDDDEGDF